MTDQDRIKDYTQTTLEQGENGLKDALCEVEKKIKQGHEQVTQWASDIDKQAHENPWPLIGGVGVGCLLLGLIISKSKN